MTSFMDGPYAKLPFPWCQQMFVLLLFRSLCHQKYVLCIVGRHSKIRMIHLTLADSSVGSGKHWIKLYREIFR